MNKLYFLLFFAFGFLANAQIVNIPDANFKAALLSASTSNYIASTATPYPNGGVDSFNTIDTNGDGEIQVSEAEAIKYLSVISLSISDLTGIESFTNLVELRCANNSLTSLDLSDLTDLYTLNCGNNQLTNLNLTNCINLYWLYCSNNQLTSLDVSNYANLHLLQCRYNQLNNLDISGCINLEEISCYNNQLTSLNVSNSINLTSFDCQNNQLTNLDVSNFVGLTSLNCISNELINLNVSGCTNLNMLSCGGNQLTSLDVSGCTNLNSLEYVNGQLTSLDASNCTGLYYLNCESNQLSNLNLTGCVNLAELYCNDNQLTSLDVSDLIDLYWLLCNNNQLISLNVAGCTGLGELDCSNNQLTSLDVSDCNSLWEFNCSNNQLIALFIKTGNNDFYFQMFGNPNLEYICADEENVDMYQQQVIDLSYTNCNVNSYCSFTPGGTFYEISGSTKFDFNNDGCDITDFDYKNLSFNISDGNNLSSMISNQTGNYYIPVGTGVFTITPNLENPAYFNISPANFTVNFPTDTSPYIQDFCVTANGIHSDVEVVVIPTIPARPGFDAHYRIIYKNIGNQVENGEVTFKYFDDKTDYVSSSVVFDSQTYYGTESTLHWNYSNLLPFETRVIDVVLNVNSPTETPAVNIGDILGIFSTISTTNSDEDLSNNSSSLRQVVVGSYDPNDKTCIEGETVDISMVGEYVYYVIRFENTGTYPAENIVVKDMIDTSKFDVSTLIPLHGSHEFFTRINDNKVEFIFEDINLDFNDATNDGYVAFKIKTLPTLNIGDTFSNDANIYFDYNFPITTNTFTTTIDNVLNNQDFNFENEFVLYPNPTTAILNISSKNQTEVQSVEIYNIVGQVVIAIPNTTKTIDVSGLEAGTYFIKLNTEKGSSTTKFVKE